MSSPARARAMTGHVVRGSRLRLWLPPVRGRSEHPRGSFRHLPSGGSSYIYYNSAAASSIRSCEVFTTGSWSDLRGAVFHRSRRLGERASSGSGPGAPCTRFSKASVYLCFRPRSAATDSADRRRAMSNSRRCAFFVLQLQLCIAVSVPAKIARRFGANGTRTRPRFSMRIPSTCERCCAPWKSRNVSLNAIGVRPAEIVIEPEVIDFDLSEFMRARSFFTAGERAALVQVPKIQQLLARLDPLLFKPAR